MQELLNSNPARLMIKLSARKATENHAVKIAFLRKSLGHFCLSLISRKSRNELGTLHTFFLDMRSVSNFMNIQNIPSQADEVLVANYDVANMPALLPNKEHYPQTIRVSVLLQSQLEE